MTTKTAPPAWAIRTDADREAIRQGYYWDQDQADRVLAFVATYFRPQYIEGEFTPLPWQSAFLQSLYGFRHPTGRRRWKRAVLHCAKKNGGLPR